MNLYEKVVQGIGHFSRARVVLPEPKRWQVGDVEYMQDASGTYFAIGKHVYCESGYLVDPIEGEAVLLRGEESSVIKRRMGL